MKTFEIKAKTSKGRLISEVLEAAEVLHDEGYLSDAQAASIAMRVSQSAKLGVE